jgi:hypothetical protein
MQRKHFWALTGLALALAACSSNEIGNSKDVAQETIYQQYRISYTEGDEKATVFAQFRFGGQNGTTLVLNPPSGVQFDGTAIKVDSSDFGGAFYEVQKPIAGFYGSHSFVFTDLNRKKFENGFVFGPLRLVSPPTSAPRNLPLQLRFDSATLRPGDEIDINTTQSDSSFSVTHSVSNGYTATIPAAELQRQKAASLSLTIVLRRSLRLQQNTAEGGEMDIRQQLKPIKIALSGNGAL